MTPKEKADSLLGLIQTEASAADLHLPETQYSVLGEPVIDCASVIVALTDIVHVAGYPEGCGAPQLGTFVIAITRDCSIMFDPNGNTIPDKADEVATIMSLDSDFLWDWANGYNHYISKSWTMGYTLTGGIGIVSMSLTTGID